MAHGNLMSKASEQFRERMVTRYLFATRDLARPDPSFDITDSNARRELDFTPRPSTDTALNAFAQLLLLRLNVSHALISLIDSTHQYVLAEATGLSARDSNVIHDNSATLWLGSVVIPKDVGVCSVVLPNSAESAAYHTQDRDVDPDVVVLDDLKEDPRFCNRPFVVSGPQMRWYAGAPIRSPDGAKLGAVCVFDVKPRQGLSREERLFLCESAWTAMNHLEAVRIQAEYQRRDRLIEGLDAFVSGLSELATQRVDASDVSLARDFTDQDASRDGEAASVRALAMWEAALPSGCKLMFTRAANIVRSAGGYDGAAFFYIPSVEFSTKAKPRQGGLDEPFNQGTHHSSTPGSFSPSHPEDLVDPTGTPFDGELSSGDEAGADSICPILGFSVNSLAHQPHVSRQRQFPSFLVRDMHKLLGRRPQGRVYMLDNSGAPLVGDSSSSSSGGETRNLENQKPADSSPLARQTRHYKRRAAQVRALLKLEPEARAFVCLPLWDYNRQRWFALGVCWIFKPNRDLAADRDLRFLQVYGNSMTNALQHLDSVEESRAKDSFVSSVSHELRSPLHGILGATNFLYDSNMGRFQREMVDTITSCGRTLLDSLEHVMDFAKINNFSKTNADILAKVSSSGKQQTETNRENILAASSLTSTVDMNQLIEEVVEAVVLGFTVQYGFLYSEDAITGIGVTNPNFSTRPRDLSKSNRARSNRGHVRLCLDLPAGNCNFETQPGAWRRIIMNLVGNALKYTEEGYINISLRIQDAAPRTGGQSMGHSDGPSDESWLILAVRDTGIGMTNEFMQNRIFKAFSQEDSLTAGTGLGLSIVDQVVKSMGGHVEVASAKGLGSTFSAHVSLRRGVPKPTQNLRADSIGSVAHRLNGKRICILEDNHSQASRTNSDHSLRAEDHFSRSLVQILKDSFGVSTTVVSQWSPQSADLIICLEPSFRQLQSIRSLSEVDATPPVLLIAHDALEVAVLRADSRITSQESFVEITYQPLGPRKLAAALLHCLEQSRMFSPRSSTDSLVNEKSRFHLQNNALSHHSTASGVLAPSGLGKETTPSSGDIAAPKARSCVLCVDDNPLNLRLLTAFVETKKLPYEAAVNGQQAVDIYTAAPRSFRCVLMDISMPIMDGMTATRIIRQHEAENSLPRVPIFALTGLASAAARTEALEAGIDRLYTKPVPFSALHEILSQSTASPTPDDGDNIQER